MAEGITQLEKVVLGVVSLANGADALAHTDWAKALTELLDLDDAEAIKLASDLQVLDLQEKDLEAKIEKYASDGGQFAAIFIRVLRLLLPKK